MLRVVIAVRCMWPVKRSPNKVVVVLMPTLLKTNSAHWHSKTSVNDYSQQAKHGKFVPNAAVQATQAKLAELPQQSYLNPDGSVIPEFQALYDWLASRTSSRVTDLRRNSHLAQRNVARQVMMAVEMRYRPNSPHGAHPGAAESG